MDTGGKNSIRANFCSSREQRAGFSVRQFHTVLSRTGNAVSSALTALSDLSWRGAEPGSPPRPLACRRCRMRGRAVTPRGCGRAPLWWWHQLPCPYCPFQPVILQISGFFSTTKLFCFPVCLGWISQPWVATWRAPGCRGVSNHSGSLGRKSRRLPAPLQRPGVPRGRLGWEI